MLIIERININSFSVTFRWASIVIATVDIRTLLAPITINQHKVASKLNNCSRFNKRWKIRFHLFKLTRLFFQAPVFVSFFLAIENMVEKVPSFQNGGASWFIDLTIVDAFYILPLLAAISCWITVEFTMQKGKCGGVWKNIARDGATLTLPLIVPIKRYSLIRLQEQISQKSIFRKTREKQTLCAKAVPLRSSALSMADTTGDDGVVEEAFEDWCHRSDLGGRSEYKKLSETRVCEVEDRDGYVVRGRRWEGVDGVGRRWEEMIGVRVGQMWGNTKGMMNHRTCMRAKEGKVRFFSIQIYVEV
uniref:Uncharacterized protein n=1 Tax=Lactuca sativa TaxID=4236 RepID=A0A9R1WAY0_LACSA|nr:hypothetical protein LSAT_V11C300133780 [Lactuca sativa]